MMNVRVISHKSRARARRAEGAARFFSLLAAVLAPAFASAQGRCEGPHCLTNVLPADTVEGFLALVLQAAVQIGVLILIVMLVWSGFLFVRAQGNPGELQKVRQTLLWTVLGGLLLLGAEALALALEATILAL